MNVEALVQAFKQGQLPTMQLLSQIEQIDVSSENQQSNRNLPKFTQIEHSILKTRSDINYSEFNQESNRKLSYNSHCQDLLAHEEVIEDLLTDEENKFQDDVEVRSAASPEMEQPQKLMVNPLTLNSEEKQIQKQQKLYELKLEQEYELMKECSFKPQLCRKSMEMAHGKEKLETKADRIQKLKQRKLQNLQKIQELREQIEFEKQCTFQPQICQKSIMLIERKWEQLPDDSCYYPQIKTAQIEEPNFHPQITEYKQIHSETLDSYLKEDIFTRLTSPLSVSRLRQSSYSRSSRTQIQHQSSIESYQNEESQYQMSQRSRRRTLIKKPGFIFKNKTNSQTPQLLSQMQFEQRQNLAIEKKISHQCYREESRSISLSKQSKKIIENKYNSKNFQERQEQLLSMKNQKIKQLEHQAYRDATFKPLITVKAQNLQNKSKLEEDLKNKVQQRQEIIKKQREDKENRELKPLEQKQNNNYHHVKSKLSMKNIEGD